MHEMPDDRLDATLAAFLEWQANEHTGAIAPTEITARIAGRPRTGALLPAKGWIAVLAVLSLLVTAVVVASIGGHPARPAMVAQGLPLSCEPVAVDIPSRASLPAVGPALIGRRDGLIAFLDGDDIGPGGINLIDPAGQAAPRRLVEFTEPDTWVRDMGWSPDGRWLAFVTTRAMGERFLMHSCTSLNVVSADGSKIFRIGAPVRSSSSGGVDFSSRPRRSGGTLVPSAPFTWAPDSHLLAYLQPTIAGPGSGSTDSSRLEIVAIDEAGPSAPISVIEGTGLGSPTWSPTGDRIALFLTSAKPSESIGEPGLVTLTAGADGSTEAASGIVIDEVLGWSADGSHLIASGPGDRADGEFYVVSLDHAPIRVLDAPGTLDDGLLSPDGSRLLFSTLDLSDAGTGVPPSVYTATLDGSDLRALASRPNVAVTPLAWSADSRRILVSSWDPATTTSHWSIITADGSEETELVPGGTDLVAWQRLP